MVGLRGKGNRLFPSLVSAVCLVVVEDRHCASMRLAINIIEGFLPTVTENSQLYSQPSSF